jgi:hypothetical protein
VYWGASASGGAIGAWYLGPGAEDGPYGYGGWYDPGDDGYDPSTNSGGIVADPSADDGSGWDAPDDGSGDPNGDNGGDDGDGSGDGSGDDGSSGDGSGDGSGDSSGEGLKRLHLHDVSASPLPSSAPSASSSSSSSPSSPSVAPGCYACTMGCRTEATLSPTGRQAVGLSDTSYDEACASAVRTLAQWSHDTLRERLATCQQIATASR